MNDITCRLATADDASVIYRFIVELADFEKGAHLVSANKEILRQQMLQDKPPFESVIAERNGKPVGFAVFFPSYSTWEAREGLYLEDLYVIQEARQFGVGRALFSTLCEIARSRGYARIDWKVLNWNQQAIEFYKRIGAKPMSDWTGYRLDLLDEVTEDSRENTNLPVGG